ncbi:unnamed protein product [Acanthoscelides obtectus]|uniref:RNA polymerase II-associated protein 1 n=1 Tax=Acanthoscelides obtectus TaxID=200917 RepID=A0A9P0K4Z3_ACAOB|nr:unnamed protein product [Acanthoscelides obtectus]CAK1620247.1 RNA polymerase II-associated protein 1 [Acanthoscelides obtectus]
MYSRPKPGETEEDILKLQDEFLKSKDKIKAAAKVISAKTETSVSGTSSEADSGTKNVANIEEQLANTFEAVPTNMQLRSIIEKQNQTRMPQVKFNNSRGFPQAKRRDPNISSGHGSIFAQHIKKMKKDETPMEVDPAPISDQTLVIKEKSLEGPSCSCIRNEPSQFKKKNLPSQSYILTGSDSKQIHEENLGVMQNMSEEEITEERERLIQTMDPAIIAYLKSRRKKEMLENRNPTIKEQNEAAEDVKIEDIETTKEILAHPKAEKWLNFEVVENNKLAWMKEIDIPQLKNGTFEARFDFEGWLLPYAEPEINEKNRILYHHGEEPGRPGYTLQELFQLSRSSVNQQKIMALNAIANILSLHSTGVYDEILDLPIEQIFFVIRFCLDDNTPAVLNASIKALRNLFFSQVDETCLDSILGFGVGMIQPILAVDHQKEDDNTVNDQQLAEKNLVRCLLRTDILTRIRYIINTVKPPLETIVYCMDILIRMARDSEFLLSQIFDCDGLLKSIIAHFVPKQFLAGGCNSAYGLPLLQAIKLLRIISARGKAWAIKLLKKYAVLDSIVSYLSDDTFSANVNGMRLQSECMHFWSLLSHYRLTENKYSTLEPVLICMLNYHAKNTNINLETTFVREGHVAALLILLGNEFRINTSRAVPFLPLLLEQCLPKWISQFSKMDSYVCGKLQIIASLIYCLSSIRGQLVDEAVLAVIHSEGFKIATDKITSGSMLLNNYETHKSGPNLKTLEAAAWHTMDHVVPILQTNSCIPFLYPISRYVKVTCDRKVKLAFLRHPNIVKYLTSLQKLDRYYLTSHWFSRPETSMLMSMLKASVDVQADIDTAVFYELAVKCLCVFNCEQKPDIEFIFSNIVFSTRFYPSEVLMENLDISKRNENLKISLNNLDEIREVYIQVLGLKSDVPDLTQCCSIDISVGNVIPIDWIYTPILVLYVNHLQNKVNVDEAQQLFTVKNCLRWILLYETYFPFLASTINPTDKFCRLACLFLGSDSLFLATEIHELLELCFKNVIATCGQTLNFNKEIQGLTNFQDFYTQLLEQYQSVSYGDTLFGNVILVPLAQKHNAQYRKTLWSEYMGAVQVFNVTPEQCFCELKWHLEPPEEDMSLLKCYRRAIVNNLVKKNTVLYTIANHHVEQFVGKRKKEKIVTN